MREFVTEAQRDPLRRREQFWRHNDPRDGAGKLRVDYDIMRYI